MPELFPFAPDWERPFRIEHSYRTEIIVSRAQREQRVANRQLPRKVLEYDVKLSRGRLAEFHAFMAKNQQGVFWVQDWTRWVNPSAPMASGADTIPVTAVPGWVLVGQRIWIREGGVELTFEVVATGPGTIQISPPAPVAFSTAARAYCVYEATIGQRTRNRLMTNTVGQATLAFDIRPGSLSESEPAAPLAFNGRELFLTKPDWATEPSVELEGFLQDVDFDIGITDHFALTSFNRRYAQLSFLFRGNAAAEDFLAFYRRCRGQRGEFYYPTWEPDISLAIGAAAGASTLDVPGVEFNARYAGSSVYRALIVFFKDGTFETRAISGVALAAGNSRITISGAWSRAVNSTTARMISLLPVWRFATDDITVEWLTNSVAQAQTTFCTLEDL